ESAGAESVGHADGSESAPERLGTRATLADALHQAGDIGRAAALFAQAEQIQAERQPDLPLLYSLSGYRYCDLWLTQGKAADVLSRYEDLVSIRGEEDPILDRALEDLLAGRAHAALAQPGAASAGPGAENADQRAAELLDNAVIGLIESNAEHCVPLGFLAR